MRALTLAKLQLAGGQPWGEVIVGTCTLFVCRKCGTEYQVTDGLDPCAFCDDCKEEVLDALAKALIKANGGAK